MASILARHACRSLRYQHALRTVTVSRPLHSTSVVQKKKGKAVIEDDLFADDAFAAEEELFKDTSASENAASGSTTASDADPTRVNPNPHQPPRDKNVANYKRPKLTSNERLARFEKELAYLTPRIGRTPSIPNSPVRRTIWIKLLELANSPDEVSRIVALLPNASAQSAEVNTAFAESLAKRCHELKCPQHALAVFGDYAKYHVPLTLRAARWMLHSIYLEHPIQMTLLAASLYTKYPEHVPVVEEDLPSAAMLAAACFKHSAEGTGTEEARKLGKDLVPTIKRLLEAQWAQAERQVKSESKPARPSESEGKIQSESERVKEVMSTAEDMDEARVKKWVAWCVRRVNKAIMKETPDAEPFVDLEMVPTKIRVPTASERKAVADAWSPAAAAAV